MHQQRAILLLFSSFLWFFCQQQLRPKTFPSFVRFWRWSLSKSFPRGHLEKNICLKLHLFYVDSFMNMLFYLHRILCGFIIDPCSITVVHHVQTYLSCSPQWKVIFCPIKTNSHIFLHYLWFNYSISIKHKFYPFHLKTKWINSKVKFA